MKIESITKTAMITALIFLATYVLKIPVMDGYCHLGDCFILIGVLVLGTKKGALAAGVGAGLADFIGGYVIWVIPTFLIKALMAVIIGFIVEKILKDKKNGWIIGCVIGGIFQIAAYTLVKIPLYSTVAALAEFPFLCLQTLAGVVIATILVKVLAESGVLSKFKLKEV